MKLTHTMDDIQWQTLIHNVAQYYNDLTIKRGFQYFKQGRVHQFMMAGADHIEAVVEGTENYQVDIHLESLSANQCTCPVHRNCKHMIAVLLKYANLQERPLHALINAHSTATFKQTVKSSPTAVSNRTAIQRAERKSEEYAKLKEQANLIPTLPISEWHNLFEQCIIPLGLNIQNNHYTKDALASIYTIKPPLSPTMEQLFSLHAHLFILNKLVTPSKYQGHNSNLYMGYHTQVAADDIQEEIQHNFAHKLTQPVEPEQWDRVTETLTYLRSHMLTETQNLQYYTDTYHQFWLHWVYPNPVDTTIYLEELQHLDLAKDELGTALSRLPWMLAQSWMHFYLGQDQQAWALLQMANKTFTIPPDHVLHFLNVLYKAEVWSRMTEWLIQTGPLLSSHRKVNLSHYLVYWEALIQHQPEAEPHMWGTLVGMLPYSSPIYQEKLLTYNKWQQWMDYQLSTGKEPLDFRVAVLQPIEKHAPELLLPFYHQAVERYILHKNRDSYKAAVKLLKRLSKLYKKMKQEARWEEFITTFAGRHSRLRALQEELRKGKLIS
ncbi:SWIM zinc finger family protein [Paenibacillus sp. IHBB 10380]|uniref:SWIM zinc finger family protein n=1 Tax=Paenibacillus sp. IHBB 10380 TaxID=1566358 RepID=UPI0005CFB084|nr:SWIM zinc finger family protein [Paenibacillus sp. IHBB 10380]AJS60908.1 hypothetical protein UB51_23390 [Paenibacillus sp. IHBB 10380]